MGHRLLDHRGEPARRRRLDDRDAAGVGVADEDRVRLHPLEEVARAFEERRDPELLAELLPPGAVGVGAADDLHPGDLGEVREHLPDVVVDQPGNDESKRFHRRMILETE